MNVGEILHRIHKATQLNTEIFRRLLVENIFISGQALTYARMGVVTIRTFPSRITIPKQVQVHLSTKLQY